MKRILSALVFAAVIAGVYYVSDVSADRPKRKTEMNKQEKIMQKIKEDKEKAKKCAECGDDKECKKALNCEEETAE